MEESNSAGPGPGKTNITPAGARAAAPQLLRCVGKQAQYFASMNEIYAGLHRGRQILCRKSRNAYYGRHLFFFFFFFLRNSLGFFVTYIPKGMDLFDFLYASMFLLLCRK